MTIDSTDMEFEVVDVFVIPSRATIILVGYEQSCSFRTGDLIDSVSGRWRIVGAEHIRPSIQGTDERENLFGMSIESVSPIYTPPTPGWFELLGKPNTQ